MRKPFNWKIFVILVAAAMFGAVAIIPYQQALSSQPQPITPQMIALGAVNAGVIFGLYAAIGLLVASAIGLGLPIVEAALRHEPTGKAIRGMLPISILLGAAAGLLLIGVDYLVFQPLLVAELGDKAPAVAATVGRVGPWRALLASFYGAFNEEIFMRLCIMSLIAWLGHFIFKTAEGGPTQGVLWTANILTAVLFGVLHLPATSALMPLTPLVVTRAIIGNGIGGVVFGYLYMKRGLESAMTAHFSADVVLHVLFAL